MVARKVDTSRGAAAAPAGGETHAVVIGGSMAGLVAARALAAHFDRVTMVERDHFPSGPQFRAGVPQSRHLHVLLVRGNQLLERFFPGLTADLRDAGALTVRWPADVLWLSSQGWGRRFPQGLSLLVASRELIEWGVRRHVGALPNVRVLDGHEATGVLASADNTAVQGVRVRARTRGEGAAADETPLAADLVVDAGGRHSPAPGWLAALGYARPPETTIDAFLGYASRYYARPQHGRHDWQGIVIGTRPPADGRGGVLFPVEGDRWLVTLAGYGRDYPPTDEAGFLEFARSLRSPVLYEAIRDAQPLSPVRGYRQTENHWRHYERLTRRPERFLVMGDAACAFNPVYGQGMTAAALAASTLEGCLREQRRRFPDGSLAGLARRFQRNVAKTSSAIWLLATGEDLRYPTTMGTRPGPATRLIQRYVDRVIEVATEHPGVDQAFLEVMHLLRPPSALFRPGVLLSALHGRRDAPLEQPPPAPAPATPLAPPLPTPVATT